MSEIITNPLEAIKATDVATERNQLAIALADSATPETEQEILQTLIDLVLDPKTINERGSLIYAIADMQISLKPSVVVDILLSCVGQFEAFGEILLLIENRWYEEDGVEAEIRRLEEWLVANKPRWNERNDYYEGVRKAHFEFVERTAKIIQLSEDIPCPMMPWPIAILNMQVSEIAEKNNLRLDSWDEDGLGPTKGFAVILPSSLWVMVKETEHSVEMGFGPTIELGNVEPTEQVDDLISDVLSSFGLTEQHIQTKRIRNTDCWT